MGLIQLPHADLTPSTQILADPDDQIQTMAAPAPESDRMQP